MWIFFNNFFNERIFFCFFVCVKYVDGGLLAIARKFRLAINQAVTKTWFKLEPKFKFSKWKFWVLVFANKMEEQVFPFKVSEQRTEMHTGWKPGGSVIQNSGWGFHDVKKKLQKNFFLRVLKKTFFETFSEGYPVLYFIFPTPELTTPVFIVFHLFRSVKYWFLLLKSFSITFVWHFVPGSDSKPLLTP